MADYDVTGYDNPVTPANEGEYNIDGLLVVHPTGGVVSGTGGYTPFLRQNSSDGTTTGFNTSDANTLSKSGTENLDMDKAWTQSLRLSDLPIIYRNGIAYYEIRLDLNEENNTGLDAGGAPNTQLELSEFQIYWSGQQATLADYTEGSSLVLGTGFNNVFDLDEGGDNSLILIDGASGSGRDDYAFYIPVSNFVGADPDDYFTLFAQFGPSPAEGATFEEFRIQTAYEIDGTKFNDVNADGVRDLNGVDNVLGNGDDEVGLAGFTMYIDGNNNNLLDAGETTTESGAGGAFTFYGLIAGTYTVREVLTAADLSAGFITAHPADWETYLPPNTAIWQLTTGTNGGDHVVSIVTANGTALVGNHPLIPEIHIEKSALVPGGTADVANEVIAYTLLVTNTGDVPLTGIVVTDPYADLGSINSVLQGDGIHNVGDVDDDGVLDLTEQWEFSAAHTVTQAEIDSNGGGNGLLENTARVDSDQGVWDDDDANVPVDQKPALSIVKSASVAGNCADVVGELITYTVVLDNVGNVTLDTVVLTDAFEGGAALAVTVTGDANSNSILDVGEVWLSGNTGNDALMGVNETWTYSYVRAVTQAMIDGGGTLDNIAYGNAEAVNSNEAAAQVSDDASVAVCQDPLVDIIKYVSLDGGTTWHDANDPTGPEVNVLGGDAMFKLVVTNTGNTTLTNVVVQDSDFDLNGGATGTGWLVGGDGILSPDESYELIISAPLTSGQHVNTATVTTDQDATDFDLAHYFGLINDGPGVRTPGFWQNPNNGGQFWDGIVGNEKNGGQDCFADGELARIDWNADGVIDNDDGEHWIIQGGQKGLLLGDWNLDGIENNGEDTLFISLSAAQILINASQKEQQDGRYMLGRDVVATWLNYLAGNDVGTIANDGHDSAMESIQGAIDFLQTYGDTADNGIFKIGSKIGWEGMAIKTSSAPWQNWGADLHGDLDEYNNTGWIDGQQYAHDCDDSAFAAALTVYNHSIDLF
ncbi:MAG: hypothetical protein ABIO43_09970 [Sphingomicrobium sp.]